MNPEEWRKLGLFGEITAVLVGYPLGLYGMGRALEVWVGLPSGAAVLAFPVGFGLAFYQIYRISKREL